MRRPLFIVSLSLAFASLSTAIVSAARAITEFIVTIALVVAREARYAFQPVLRLVDQLLPAPAFAGYATPPDTFVRHEAFVSHRSAARGT